MSSQRYNPPVQQPATLKELQAISDDLNYHCSPEQIQVVTEGTNDLIATLKILDTMSDFAPEVKYPRTPGYRPQPKDRFGNAWAWRSDITGAPSGKLYGKTLAIKDNAAVAGVPMSNGSRLLEGYIPEYDATVVTRILDAGGRILGKSSCDDFCLSAMGFSSVDGFIHNPSNPEYRIGGSSGGSAVLVAGGQVDMAIAGDQGGSIRIPAAWTGTVGLKATYGLVPYTGVVSIEPTVDHVGPIAKTVTDCALLLEVIAGSDGLDGRQMTSPEVPEYSKLLEVEVNGKVLGVLKEGVDACVQETQSAVNEFLTTVGLAGLSTKNVSVPLHQHALDLLMCYLTQGCNTMLQLGTSGQFLHGFYPTSLEKAIRQGLLGSAGLLAPGIKHFTMMGEFLQRRYGNHYYCKARNIVLELSNQYEEALKQCDVIVMPTLTHTASKFIQHRDTETESLRAYLKESTDQIGNTVAANLTGHPALSLPLGKLGDGSTDSLMIVGRKYDDLTVLQVARALEKIITARN
uniref:Amidase domain-containing protein n=1 Tax=Arion vulgaris TaxID=1028688 RepID=A0A0B7B463_9EUPU